MLDTFTALNNLLAGKPAGGHVHGVGISIMWQNGPLGRGKERKAPNGAFVETVIAAVVQRIEFYQDAGFHCAENEAAIMHLQNALKVLDNRTKAREAANVEGTHGRRAPAEGNPLDPDTVPERIL